VRRSARNVNKECKECEEEHKEHDMSIRIKSPSAQKEVGATNGHQPIEQHPNGHNSPPRKSPVPKRKWE